MGWLFLALAILTELCGTTSMKLSQAFTQFWPSVALIIFYVLSSVFLTLALHTLPLGVANAIWSGIGTACTMMLDAIFFDEPLTLTKMISAGLIVIGVIGLHVT